MRRLALSLLAATLLVLFAPLLARDRVVFPHDNTLEAGLAEGGALGPPSNRRFSDASHYYVPALAQQLRGNSSGWISTWDPHVELGRPSIQLYGLGKAFLPTHLLSWFSDDPLRVYTWSAVLAIALGSLFGFLLLEALGLHPLACLLGAVGIGIGSLALYAQCFTLFLWGVCWTTALFWCATLFLRRPSPWSGLGLAFFTHALLLSGYPQFIVWQAYLLAGYVLLGLARHGGGTRRALGLGARLVACVGIGAASAFPVYWDLFEDARRSTRLTFDPEFFARILPDLDTWADKGAFAASLFDAFAFGNPSAPEFPNLEAEPFLLPLWSALAVAGLVLGERRRTWPILLCVGAALTLTVWSSAYVATVRTLGLGLSRSVPIRLAHLPLVVLAALAADRVLRGGPRRTRLAAGLVLLASGVAAAGLAASDLPVERANLAFAAAVVAGVLAFVLTRKAWLLAGLTLASAIVYGERLQVTRARDQVCLDSPLLEFVRAQTQDGRRFAWTGANPSDHVAPNQEALYGLRSIHTYNPLSSTLYQGWSARYDPLQGRATRDRRFESVFRTKAFLQESAALAATAVLLSEFDQSAAGVTPSRSFGPIRVFQVEAPSILQHQTAEFERTDAASVRMSAPRAAEPAPVRTLDEDEHLVFRVTAAERQTLLFISQQHHPRWEARAGGKPLETVVVNELFQGVLVPPGAQEIELVFRSAARWSWLAQAAFPFAAAFLFVRRRACLTPVRDAVGPARESSG